MVWKLHLTSLPRNTTVIYVSKLRSRPAAGLGVTHSMAFGLLYFHYSDVYTFHCCLLPPQDHPSNIESLQLCPPCPDCLLMFSEVQIENIFTAKVSFREQETEKGGPGGLEKTAFILRRIHSGEQDWPISSYLTV